MVSLDGRITMSGTAQSGAVRSCRKMGKSSPVRGGSADATVHGMSKIAVGVAALLLVHCSSSSPTSPPSKASNDLTSGASSCMAPGVANTLDAGYGCQQGTQTQTGCTSSEYELVCFGTDAGAAAPATSLNCNTEAIPGQIANLMHYCCACAQ